MFLLRQRSNENISIRNLVCNTLKPVTTINVTQYWLDHQIIILSIPNGLTCTIVRLCKGKNGSIGCVSTIRIEPKCGKKNHEFEKRRQMCNFLSVFLSDVSVRNVVAVARKFTTKISFVKPERKFTICDVSLVPFAENNSPRVKCCTCSLEMTDSSAEITTSNKVR